MRCLLLAGMILWGCFPPIPTDPPYKMYGEWIHYTDYGSIALSVMTGETPLYKWKADGENVVEMGGEIVVGDNIIMLTVEEYFHNYRKIDSSTIGPFYFSFIMIGETLWIDDMEFERIR